MKTLILGMGNPILSDDGVGVWVARSLKHRLEAGETTVMESSMAGLNLIEAIEGFERAIIIDAIQTGRGEVGRVYRLEPEAFDDMKHSKTPHGVDFTSALGLGSRLGLSLPRQITIFAIEVEDVNTFGEGCTPQVERMIPVVVDMVIQELDG